jgi:hypothetical protein
MDISTVCDLYSPSVNEMGDYVDKIPSFANIKGLRCACGSRKDKIYETNTMFSNHTKTKAHQKWLANLNLNKTNYYVEVEELKDTVQQQRLIIAKLERESQNKTMTIEYLTQQLIAKNANQQTVNNLLGFD